MNSPFRLKKVTVRQITERYSTNNRDKRIRQGSIIKSFRYNVVLSFVYLYIDFLVDPLSSF